MIDREVLALISDTHLYRAGLPSFFNFLQRYRIERLACLGDCEAEPFYLWLVSHPGRELYWVYDVHWPDLPNATDHGMALALKQRIILAHTRATAFIHFKDTIAGYKKSPASGRSPLLICHGHTHTPSVTRFGHSLNQILYINSATRHRVEPRQELLQLAHDTVYLVVPGAFTLEEGRYPNFNFSLLDSENQEVEMVSLAHVEELQNLRSSLTVLQGRDS
jgi:predicted phosphodiesterase